MSWGTGGGLGFFRLLFCFFSYLFVAVRGVVEMKEEGGRGEERRGDGKA